MILLKMFSVPLTFFSFLYSSYFVDLDLHSVPDSLSVLYLSVDIVLFCLFVSLRLNFFWARGSISFILSSVSESLSFICWWSSSPRVCQVPAFFISSLHFLLWFYFHFHVLNCFLNFIPVFVFVFTEFNNERIHILVLKHIHNSYFEVFVLCFNCGTFLRATIAVLLSSSGDILAWLLLIVFL